MSEDWERVRPSWTKISPSTTSEPPMVTFGRSRGTGRRSGYDRISLNKAATSSYLSLEQSAKCTLLIRKKSRELGIQFILTGEADQDSFTLSLHNSTGTIRRKNLFEILGIDKDVSDQLRITPFRTPLRAERGGGGTLFVCSMPDKEVGKASDIAEVPSEDVSLPDMEDL